jgi:hypothetical protein
MSIRARFYERHRGISGPGVPLPKKAAEIADRWEGREGDPAELAAELREAFPDSGVRDVPPATWDRSDFGMITLMCPADGFPRHSWRFIKYDVLDPTVERTP